MNPHQHPSLDYDPQLPNIKVRHSSSPRHHSTPTPTAGAARKIGVAVDLSDESAYAVLWSVQHYLRPGDAVVLLHVQPTSVLYGADWGPLPLPSHTNSSSRQADGANDDNEHKQSQAHQKKLEDDFDAFTSSKIADLAKPLKEAQIPFKVHIVKDHDMRERLCLEIERLGLSAVIMGSRGFGAAKRGSDGKLGSVSDYCVHHCVCPVVVVRYPDDNDGAAADNDVALVSKQKGEEEGVDAPPS